MAMDFSGPMNPATVVQAGASVFGFLFVGYQLWQARRNTRGGTEHTLYSHYTEVCKLLMGNPHLQPYFYNNKSMLSPDMDNLHLREQIDIMSEAILGLIEHSALHEPNLPGDTWKNCWMPYAYERLHKSEELQRFYNLNRAWYTTTLQRCIDAYFLKAKLFQSWRDTHGSGAVKVTDLSDSVISEVMGSREFWHNLVGKLRLRKVVVSYRLGKLTDTPVAGFVLRRQKPAHMWQLTSYALLAASSGQVSDGLNMPEAPLPPELIEATRPLIAGARHATAEAESQI